MAEYIDKTELSKAMYHESFEKDSELQRWDSGCWIRYKLFENVVESIPIADVLPIPDGGIGEVSDGYHTFNGLYYQRMVLFATLVKQNKDKSWKSLRHEDGELCFGGGWFIVGIDTPDGSYTYHYEDNFWSMFDCQELPVAKHWDGHTEKDATRLLSLADVQPVVHCKDCIRRPHYDPPDSDHNSDLVFPDKWNSLCPFYCEDNWYSEMPHDDWFCNFGKRKDGET